MPLSLIIFIGLFGVLLVLFFKNPIINRLGENNKMVHKLQTANWYQNYWLAGIFLFGMNAVLFFATIGILYLLMFLIIPFIHIFIMLLAVFGSIYLWIIINKAWQGTKRNRLKMGAIGSSFYLILTVLFVFLFVTLKPSYPGEDTFMKAIGLLFAIIVTAVACITCFVFTGFSQRKV
ncbi:hypothetical protein MXL46_07625 [Heyndrickxia sporothermodurans]|uniref:hypothetical protein n=1 Tax=Heyndrickxia sporothermodurans TaxID=46224 RepID=UPI000D3769CD|nr:hypothetical protein [Heyndrickxia sporothermodurans]MBL5766400.1 hypothetical protein [Heyndrickxia sporothermodurans]MBL5769839.1 hypothetical protein [Heyndrickxia sporothermodurans]MBL5776918.1 hypothetical protein [Heyndrickxia sporothermodurans]MBL5782285.1 hypothetical protein [Heyndrickxia sporothermodurans]MBL5784208.1 hypothetical protein [Heyndrickxia sporothermodurans]